MGSSVTLSRADMAQVLRSSTVRGDVLRALSVVVASSPGDEIVIEGEMAEFVEVVLADIRSKQAEGEVVRRPKYGVVSSSELHRFWGTGLDTGDTVHYAIIRDEQGVEAAERYRSDRLAVVKEERAKRSGGGLAKAAVKAASIALGIVNATKG